MVGPGLKIALGLSLLAMLGACGEKKRSRKIDHGFLFKK
jgi:hypothetical protein